MSVLHFAVAGCPHSTPSPGGTVEGLRRAHALGITSMELEWVQSVPKSKERIAEIRETAQELQIALTVHAPYYVNMNAREADKLAASKKRVLDALTMAELAGARSVCVHAAFYLGMDPGVVFVNVEKFVSDIMERKTSFPHVNLALETMGKPTQFGTLEEVLRISKKFDIYPCIDPAHMHARSNGAWNTTEEWNAMFDFYATCLGKQSLKHVHMHFSGIAFTEKGERKHLPLMQSDANWKGFITVLKNRQIEGVIVCESPLLEDDTLLLKRTFEKMG